MNTIIKLILALIILNFQFVCASVFDHEQDLAYIAKHVPRLNNISCKFSQEKYIPSANVRLNSSGNFKFEKDKGVTFYTTYPVKSTVSYKSNEYKQINNIIRAIGNKNYSKLALEFNFYFQQNGDIWTLGLKPKNNTASQKYLKSVEVEGKSNVSKIIISATDGITTTIKFF